MAAERAAIVTGASSGIGAAVARRLATAGCDVAIGYARNRDGAESVAAECRAAGVRAVAVGGDVASDADCRALAAAAVAAFGRIDYLVNNAGTSRFVAHADLDGLDAVDFARLFAVNVTGPFQVTRAALPALRACPGAAIVNVASIAGTLGIGSSVAYAASKAALINMTVTLARALGPALRVNAVAPGLVDTRWLPDGVGAERYAAVKAGIEGGTPLRAVTSADQVAEPVLWLLMRAAHVTGEVLHVDAGLHLRAGQFA